MRGFLSVLDPNAIDWALQYYVKGFIEFGTFVDGERLALSPEGFGTVRDATVYSLPQDMRMLSPEEAEKNLKDGDYFVNRSGPITSKLSYSMESGGDYELVRVCGRS